MISPVVQALCIAQEGDPYELAHSVYLAEVLAAHPIEKNSFTSSAQIKVVKIYKSDNIDTVKQYQTLTSTTRYGAPKAFIVGSQHILYGRPEIHRCNSYMHIINISSDALRLFEKQHQPIWIVSDNME